MFLPTAVFTPPIDRGGVNILLLFSFLTPPPLLPPLLFTSPFLQNGKQAGGSNFSPHVIVVVLLLSRMVVEMSNPSLGHSISTLSSTWGWGLSLLYYHSPSPHLLCPCVVTCSNTVGSCAGAGNRWLRRAVQYFRCWGSSVIYSSSFIVVFFCLPSSIIV